MEAPSEQRGFCFSFLGILRGSVAATKGHKGLHEIGYNPSFKRELPGALGAHTSEPEVNGAGPEALFANSTIPLPTSLRLLTLKVR